MQKIEPNTTLPPELEDFALVVDSGYDEVKKQHRRSVVQVEDYESAITDSRKKIENLKTEILRYKTNLVTAKKGRTEKAAALKRYKLDTARVQREWQRLHRHPQVHSVSVRSDGKIKITTKPLFADIRVRPGAKEKRRCFIGSFIITTARETVDNIHVENVCFIDRAHWSVSSSGWACQGDWADSFRDAARRGQWFQFVTTMVEYLKSTDDGAAYMTADQWRDGRRGVDDNVSHWPDDRHVKGRVVHWTGSRWRYIDDDSDLDTTVSTSYIPKDIPLDTPNLVEAIAQYDNRHTPAYVTNVLDALTDEEIATLPVYTRVYNTILDGTPFDRKSPTKSDKESSVESSVAEVVTA